MAEGVSEVWLFLEDIGVYGIDLGIDVVVLFCVIIVVLFMDGLVMFRFGMTNLSYILAYFDVVVEAMRYLLVYVWMYILV